MCLAIPAQIEVMSGHKATVALAGTRIDVLVTLLSDVKVGDWVLVHAGFAIATLDEQQARETYDLLAEMD